VIKYIPMKIQIITLFPSMINETLNSSMMFKASKNNIVEFEVIDLRQFGLGPRKQVDDTPYGGGDGMLMMPEPIFAAIEHAKKTAPEAKVILMTPAGDTLDQSMARDFAGSNRDLIIFCAHYEGYDERILSIVDKKISIGNYVLTGGELPALVFVDSVVRLLPGVLGGEKSAEIESFSQDGIIEYPQYTKPREFRGMEVPSVLVSGHHAEIEKWQNENYRHQD
jgi:tRNA (guanine37-N1)-methyltransferase